ncbi:MAG: FHA domain-containing protein [Ardenticatenaceae bacterium]|nr:FHA domain-containing protein [Ardenticatenaceae bacterium]
MCVNRLRMKQNGRLPLLLIFLLLLMAVDVRAQAGTAVTVSDAQVIEGPEAVNLNVYFSVSDPTGLQPDSTAAILLEDGSRYQAQIEKAPFYIVLVLDASGSMAPVIDDIRQAAIDLVSLAPLEAQFAVMRFTESIDLIQPFTNDQSQVIQAINQVEIDDSGTCLYDVAITAVQSLDQIARNTPRRALVLFSDGRDELRRGGGSGTCSRNTYDQLVNLASNRRVPVPIHTVGLAESDVRLNSADLSNLARATGARSAVGGSETLAQLFNEIMTDVRQQWLARAQLLPTQGYQRGILLLTDSAQNPLPSAPVSFFSSRDYRTQPDPVTVEIRNFTYDETADLYLFDVALTGYENVNHLQIDVTDVENNVQINTFPQNSPWITQQIRLVTRQLNAGRAYRVTATPVDGVGNPLKDERGSTLSATHQFRYDPPQPIRFAIDAVQVIDEAPKLNLRAFQIEDDIPQFFINLHIENGERISQYEGILIDRLDGQQTDSFPLTVGADALAQTPFSAPGGAYTLIVNALAEDGSRLATADYQFIYTPPTNAFVYAWSTLMATPLLILLFLLLLAIAILFSWLIGQAIGKRRARRKPEPIREPAPAAAKTVYIRILESPDTSQVTSEAWEVAKFPYTIGREGADLSIRGDQHISRKHARITLTDGAFYIEDLGSSNGTFVDEMKIPSRDPIILNPARGAKIRVGKTTTLSLAASTNGSEDDEKDGDVVRSA